MGIELYGVKNLIVPSTNWQETLDYFSTSKDWTDHYILACIMQHEWDEEFDNQVELDLKTHDCDGALLIAANQRCAWGAVACKAREHGRRNDGRHTSAGRAAKRGGDSRDVQAAGRGKGAGRRAKRKA